MTQTDTLTGDKLINEFMGGNWKNTEMFDCLYPVMNKVFSKAIQQGVASPIPFFPSNYGFAAIYKVCIDFIEWYNKNQNDTN